MAKITSKTLMQEPEPEHIKMETPGGGLSDIFTKIKSMCSSASEISRLCDQGLSLVAKGK